MSYYQSRVRKSIISCVSWSVDATEINHYISRAGRTLQQWTSDGGYGNPSFITSLEGNRWLYLRTDRHRGHTQIHVVRATKTRIVTDVVVNLHFRIIASFWNVFIATTSSGIVHILARCGIPALNASLARQQRSHRDGTMVDITCNSVTGTIESQGDTLGVDQVYFACIIPPHDDEVDIIVTLVSTSTRITKSVAQIIVHYLLPAMR